MQSGQGEDDEIEISPATEEKRKVGRIDRSRKNLTQRRWRARRKAEESELEEQVAELTQQVAELEIYNSSLEARHKCLHRQSELIELLHSQVPTGDNEEDDFGIWDNTASRECAQTLADFLNIFRRQDEHQLTAEECRDMATDSMICKAALRESCINLYLQEAWTRLQEISGGLNYLEPTSEARLQVEEIIERRREMIRQKLGICKRSSLSQGILKPSIAVATIYREQQRNLLDAMPEVIEAMSLTPEQENELIQRSRQVHDTLESLNKSRKQIASEIQQGNSLHQETASSSEVHAHSALLHAESALQRLQLNLKEEIIITYEYELCCMEVMTPWQEALMVMYGNSKFELILLATHVAEFLEGQHRAANLT